jgi:Protein of unknown function (DUF1553)
MPSLLIVRPIARVSWLAWLLVPSFALGDEPARAPVAGLDVFPKALVLEGPRDARRVLVTGLMPDGSKVDLSGSTTFEAPEGMALRPGGTSRRAELADWLTAPENPYFARSLVNRVWSYFPGKGIIDPVDDTRSSNPPSNPELLDALERDFIAHGFDVRLLMRTIARSRTYQASIATNEWNEDDSVNFSHASVRRLTAEQLSDAIDRAAGRRPSFAGVPGGFRASQLPDSQVAVGGFLDLFGRPAREIPCECERSSEVSLGQALNLVNGPTISARLLPFFGNILRKPWKTRGLSFSPPQNRAQQTP